MTDADEHRTGRHARARLALDGRARGVARRDGVEGARPSARAGRVQDNLVHITALERFILGDPLPAEDVPEDLPHVKNDVGRSNERWVESRRAWTGADALAEFVATTDARIAQLRQLDDDGFAADSWTPMGPGTVAQLLGFRIFDSWVHEQDMRGALERPGDLDSPAARFSIGMMLDVLPYVVGKKVGAPDGSTVVLTLTGPIVTSTAVATTDGRARLVDPVPEVPTVSLIAGLRRLRAVWRAVAATPTRPWSRGWSPSRATSIWAVPWCASSTTCSDPTSRNEAPRSPDGSGHQRRHAAATPIACCCCCTATAPTSAISVACSATSTPRAASPRCCRVVRSPRRPGSPGTTSPRTTPTSIAGGVRRRPLARSTTCSTPRAPSTASTAPRGRRRRLLAGRRARARPRRCGPRDRPRPRACSP